MRTFKEYKPEYPTHKGFVKVLDPANVSTISPNRDYWDICMENGERFKVFCVDEGPFDKFVNECQAAKLKRDTADAIKRR